MATSRKPKRNYSADEKIQVNCRLFRVDVDYLKRRARDDGVPWQTMLRSVVHQHLNAKATIA